MEPRGRCCSRGWIVAWALLALWGCGDSDPPPDSRSVGQTCYQDGDCLGDLVCHQRTCASPSPRRPGQPQPPVEDEDLGQGPDAGPQ